MHYRHFVFDIDGTLLDTEYAVLHSLQDVIRAVQKREAPVQDLRFALGITGDDALRQLGFADLAAAQRLWDERMACYQSSVRVFAGIEPLLQGLAQNGKQLGIVTSKTRAEYKTDLAPFAIARFFPVSVCADDTKRHKPFGDPLRRYLQTANATAGTVLYIGDSIYDSQCAQDAGVDFALAGWGAHRADIPARYRLQTPQQLLALLRA